MLPLKKRALLLDNRGKPILLKDIPDCLGWDRIEKDAVDEIGNLNSIRVIQSCNLLAAYYITYFITYLKRKTRRRGISGIRSFVNNYSYWPTYCLASCLHLFRIQTLTDFLIFSLCLHIPGYSFLRPSCSILLPSFLPSLSLSLFLRSAWLIMAKMTKLKDLRSPKRSHLPVESSYTQGKRSGHICWKTAAAEVSDDEPEEPATGALSLKIPGCIVWDKYPEHTECLLNYLDTHPDVAIKLFSDSTQAAISKGCFQVDCKVKQGCCISSTCQWYLLCWWWFSSVSWLCNQPKQVCKGGQQLHHQHVYTQLSIWYLLTCF